MYNNTEIGLIHIFDWYHCTAMIWSDFPSIDTPVCDKAIKQTEHQWIKKTKTTNLRSYFSCGVLWFKCSQLVELLPESNKDANFY